MDAIYQPFGRVGARIQIKQATEAYADLYSEYKSETSDKNMFEAQFLDAWNAEFGTSLDGVLAFVDQLERMHLQPAELVSSLARSNLIEVFAAAANIPKAEATTALATLTLEPRPAWRSVCASYTNKDWFPWRFRRRLSVLRKPFLQLNLKSDPEIIFAPGLVREALVAMAYWFHSGALPPQQAASSKMTKWIGHANNVQRTAFNSTVADRMRELKWKAEPEVKLSKLFDRSFDRDYGDIDVLAWHPDSGRVLVMECKDVQYHKTLGEVAEQLSDFHGAVRSDGKRDHLKKHLDRLAVVTSLRNEVARALKLQVPIKIEGHLVFKNPVPMQFAWDNILTKTQLSLFSELDRI
jgi:hypothetical protein